MTLEATEFIRRFLLHVLPRGFVKIRHFGFLANRGRDDHIRLCRTLLDASSPNVRDGAVAGQEQPNRPDHCPLCNEGRMRPVEILLPQAALLPGPCIPAPVPALEGDTS
jgi:Putative transposase